MRKIFFPYNLILFFGFDVASLSKFKVSGSELDANNKSLQSSPCNNKPDLSFLKQFSATTMLRK